MNTYFNTKEKASRLFLNSKTESDQRFYLLVILALETGARVSDLLNIKIEDFVREEHDNYFLTYKNKKGKKEQEQRI